MSQKNVPRLSGLAAGPSPSYRAVTCTGAILKEQSIGQILWASFESSVESVCQQPSQGGGPKERGRGVRTAVWGPSVPRTLHVRGRRPLAETQEDRPPTQAPRVGRPETSVQESPAATPYSPREQRSVHGMLTRRSLACSTQWGQGVRTSSSETTAPTSSSQRALLAPSSRLGLSRFSCA